MKTERRFLVELRAADGEDFAIAGYAAVFNHESKVMGGGDFVEVVAPGAFARSLKQQADVKCLFNHDSNKVLGRSKNGTLTLTTDERGLKFRCQLDKENQEHRNLYASVKRGDVDGCSFAFTVAPGGQNWQETNAEDGPIYRRTLTDVNLIDVSAVTYPAYTGTAVAARMFPDGEPAEIRSSIDELAQKRAAQEARAAEESYEQMLCEISKALAKQYPAPADQVGECWGGGKYWVIETYPESVIVCACGTGENFRIPYTEDDVNDTYLFGEPQPVEKEWVPSERANKRTAEYRGHLDSIAAAHAEAAKAAKEQADAHAAVADAAGKLAKREEMCKTSMGDHDDVECSCQNVMVERSEAYEPDDDGDEDDNPDERSQGRAGVKNKVRTKTVDGKHLTKDKFAYVGDPEKTETWKFPIHDADHVRNALARFNQADLPTDAKAGVFRKIKAAAKKFGVEVSEDDSKRCLEGVPLDATEIAAIEVRLKYRKF